MIDSRDLNDLHPALKRAAKELIARMAALGYNVLVTSTYRDFERQNQLYAQGRTAPGAIVTNCRGGESIHNYRLAFDICKNLRGGEYSDNAFFAAAGKIGGELGLLWGGTWKSFVDKPHFEFTGGLTLKQLQGGATLSDNVLLKWELENAKKEEEELVDKTTIIVDGEEMEFQRIFKDGTNYIRLRDLEKIGFVVDYDQVRKLAVIRTAKA